MPETNLLFQCHVNWMSQLRNGLTTKHYWPVPFRINFFLVKVFLPDCQLNKIGNIFFLYYDGWFDHPLFIAHGFNQLQHACCICNSARINSKNLATLKSLGVLANSEEFRRQLLWARDHPHSQEAKPLNAKVSWILSMVGSTIPYSPFEHAVTCPKLNAMRYCYGVGSNSITSAPPEFEHLLTLRLCMKPKYNDPNCVISKRGFTQSDLPDPICNKTSTRMHMTSNDHSRKLRIFIINCKFYLKQSLDAKPHQKHVEVMITFNMIDVHIIILQPSMVW